MSSKLTVAAALLVSPGCYSLVDLRLEGEVLREADPDADPVALVFFEHVGKIEGVDPISFVLCIPIETILDVVNAPGLLLGGESRVRGGLAGALAAIVLPGLNLRYGGLLPEPRTRRAWADETQWAELGGARAREVAAELFGTEPSRIEALETGAAFVAKTRASE